jgi:glycosyltransferase involved in cell wall biosynthesis
MRILVLAPQPFYQERGTPIAVKLAVETLAAKLLREGTRPDPIDLLVYGEGIDVQIPGVRIIRLRTPRWLRGIRPGISCKKLLCDILFFIQSMALLWRARSDQYDVIHAVEESVFIAWLAKHLCGIPYVYDMDSSLALQLTEKWWWCKPGLALLQYLEGLAIRGSISVAPVCDALHAIAVRQGSVSTIMLRDVSLLPQTERALVDRSKLYGVPIEPSEQLIVYVGNLESYQGIDLLLEAFAVASPRHSSARLVIVGGTPAAVEIYRSKARRLACDSRVLFLGPRPVQELASFLQSADILVSPRIKGNNTPMKVYSYLHSGTALLATDLPTHRQVLDDSIALLAPPNPTEFAAALEKLLTAPDLRTRLGETARQTAQNLYTVEAFEAQMGALYDDVARAVQKAAPALETQRVHNQ